MNNFGISTNVTFWGAPAPEAHTICCTSHWLNPKEEWRIINIVSSVCKPVSSFETMQESPLSLCSSCSPGAQLSQTKKRDAIGTKNTTTTPLWKRRGAKALPNLKLHPVIRGDVNWLEKAEANEEFLQIVNDSEWTSTQPDYFEVHSTQDVIDGIVIDPPTYPSSYTVPSTNSKVPALLPFNSEMILRNALDEGYALDSLIWSMGNAIAEYSVALIHKKRRSYQEILILARARSWQGASAIFAATKILNNWIRVSVFIVGERDDQVASGGRDTQEEDEFIAAGGSVYRNLQDLAGRKFRVVVVALEDQYSGEKTNLSLYGELLQHSVVVFVDPPVLKCSYSTALQIATNGCYNISQKTLLLVPNLPKAYVADNFIEMLVVDVGISKSVQQATTGINEVIFPQLETDPSSSKVVSVVPVDFTVRGSRLYFYRNGQRVPC